VKLSDFAGKVVVLEWINPDCPFVKRHADAGTMRSLAQKYQGRVVWIGINSTNYMDSAANAKWIADRSLPYAVLDDHTGAVGHAYNAKTTPHMYVIDTTGKLVYGGTKGASAVNYVDAALAEVTAGKPVSLAETKPYGCSVKYAK
jgi:peroxiredoxin